jgi:hypothetical protein
MIAYEIVCYIYYKLYDCYWYNTNLEETKMILFVIQNAQISLIIGTGGIFELSTNNFLKVF